MIIKAKVPLPIKPHASRQLNGMKRCGQACTACPYIKQGKSIKIDNKTSWKISKRLSCENFNIIYLISCNKEHCKENKYIGETGRSIKHGLSEHRGYIVNHKTNQATGYHFNLPGHSLSNMKITGIEQVKNSDILYRKEREVYFINKFDTYHNGINHQH